MHWRTYDRHCNKAVQAEFKSWLGLQAWLERSDARLKRMAEGKS